MRIGILGGTFDPIHLGHLAIAEAARDALGLERVLFLPAGSPPHKPAGVDAPAADRVAMVELAIAGHPGFELSRIEVDRPGPSYTVDTVERIAAAERAAGREPDLVLILSVETLAELPEWHEPARLLAACRVAVVPRPGHPPPDPAWIEASFPGAGRADRRHRRTAPRDLIDRHPRADRNGPDRPPARSRRRSRATSSIMASTSAPTDRRIPGQ